MSADRESQTTVLPSFTKDEDGQVMIHWRGRDIGLLVIVSREGEWSCSVKHHGGNYAMSDISFDPANGLPEEAQALLRDLS